MLFNLSLNNRWIANEPSNPYWTKLGHCGMRGTKEKPILQAGDGIVVDRGNLINNVESHRIFHKIREKIRFTKRDTFSHIRKIFYLMLVYH